MSLLAGDAQGPPSWHVCITLVRGSGHDPSGSITGASVLFFFFINCIPARASPTPHARLLTSLPFPSLALPLACLIARLLSQNRGTFRAVGIRTRMERCNQPFCLRFTASGKASIFQLCDRLASTHTHTNRKTHGPQEEHQRPQASPHLGSWLKKCS